MLAGSSNRAIKTKADNYSPSTARMHEIILMSNSTKEITTFGEAKRNLSRPSKRAYIN